jgi:hypothetical protein
MIKETEIESLLTIIPRGYPHLEIFHLTNQAQGICKILEKLTQKENYGYDLYVEGEASYETISKQQQANKFDIKKSRYNKHAKQYDYLFINMNLEAIENRELFLKKIYAIAKNAGKLFFIVDETYDIRALEEELIAYNYVAVNPIENTFSQMQILSAQKMHGWGN